jgi:hypothetical protein
MRRLVVRHREEAREERRDFQPRESFVMVAVVEHDSEVHAQVGNMGKRMGCVQSERGQRGKYCSGEVRSKPRGGVSGDLGIWHDVNTGVTQLRQEILLPTCHVAHQQRLQGVLDRQQLVFRRQSVRRGLDRSGPQLPVQPGHADHEELIQVGAEDGEEFQSFQQRMTGVERFLQHSFIETHPTEFAVDVEGGIGKVHRALSVPDDDSHGGLPGGLAPFVSRRPSYARTLRGLKSRRRINFQRFRQNCANLAPISSAGHLVNTILTRSLSPSSVLYRPQILFEGTVQEQWGICMRRMAAVWKEKRDRLLIRSVAEPPAWPACRVQTVYCGTLREPVG